MSGRLTGMLMYHLLYNRPGTDVDTVGDNMERTRPHTLEYESELAFRNMLPSEWLVRDKRNPDYGMDLEVEIVEKEKVTNNVLWVQLKATESTKHDGGAISYPMRTSTLSRPR